PRSEWARSSLGRIGPTPGEERTVEPLVAAGRAVVARFAPVVLPTPDHPPQASDPPVVEHHDRVGAAQAYVEGGFVIAVDDPGVALDELLLCGTPVGLGHLHPSRLPEQLV